MNSHTALEVLYHAPRQTQHAAPLLFVHGAYTAAWCWEEHFLPWFAEQGWHAYAVSLTGHGNSPGRDQLDSLTLNDYVEDVLEVLSGLRAQHSTPPVLLGHSMGGMVLQKALEQIGTPALPQLTGVALLCAVPPQGLLSSMFGMAFHQPWLLAEFNRLMSGGIVALDSLREAMFAQPISGEDLQKYYLRMQPESHRVLWDMSFFDLPRPVHEGHLPPVLVVGAALDHLISPTQVAQTAQRYHVQEHILQGMGHGIMLERDWQTAAQLISDWLHGLAT